MSQPNSGATSKHNTAVQKAARCPLAKTVRRIPTIPSGTANAVWLVLIGISNLVLILTAIILYYRDYREATKSQLTSFSMNAAI